MHGKDVAGFGRKNKRDYWGSDLRLTYAPSLLQKLVESSQLKGLRMKRRFSDEQIILMIKEQEKRCANEGDLPQARHF